MKYFSKEKDTFLKVINFIIIVGVIISGIIIWQLRRKNK